MGCYGSAGQAAKNIRKMCTRRGVPDSGGGREEAMLICAAPLVLFQAVRLL
jgi:hypothetical protein